MPKTKTNKLHFFLRILGAVLGWSLFIYWWRIVLKPPMASRIHIELSALIVIAVIILVAGSAFFWINHNLGIAQMGHRGEISRYISPTYERDHFGRVLTLPPRAVLIAAPVINLRTEMNLKTYVVDFPRVEKLREQHTSDVRKGA